MAGGGGGGLSLEETPTWVVAVVCFLLVLVSILIERSIHIVGEWLKKKQKRALLEALEKLKSELMLLGFISLLLTVGRDPISDICISEKLGTTMFPCLKKKPSNGEGRKGSDDGKGKLYNDDVIGRKLLWSEAPGVDFRRILGGGGGGSDKCAPKGKVPLISSTAINQLHIFIFVLAVFHVIYCITTMALGRAKMRRWKVWEQECKTMEYQFSHDWYSYYWLPNIPLILSDLHKLMVEAAAILNVEAPDLYIRQNPVPNAYTLAISGRKPFVVVHTSLVELLTRKELQAVKAHELGHLKCDHGVWLTFANFLTLGVYTIPEHNLLINWDFELGPELLSNSTEDMLLDPSSESLVQAWSVTGIVKYKDSKYYSTPHSLASNEQEDASGRTTKGD